VLQCVNKNNIQIIYIVSYIEYLKQIKINSCTINFFDQVIELVVLNFTLVVVKLVSYIGGGGYCPEPKILLIKSINNYFQKSVPINYNKKWLDPPPPQEKN